MPARVLVRLPNWLGDVLLARPLLHALRAARPDAELIGVGPASLLDLLAPDGTLDTTHAWSRERSGALARTLREPRLDIALVLPPSLSSAWFAWRTGARERIGYAHEGRSPLLTRSLRRAARGERHLSDEYLDLAATLGAKALPVPRLPLAPAAAVSASARLAPHGMTASDRYAVLGPGAIFGPAKRWPAERFAELGRALGARGLRVLVCGTREESEVCREVAVGVGDGAVDLSGSTSLAELAGIAAGARVAVCNDSGLAHLCAALGAPTVAIFGSTSSAWTAPRGERVAVVQKPPVCSPCFAPTCRIGYVCLTAVTVDRVARACDGALNGRAA